MSFTTFLFFGFFALVLLGWYVLPLRVRRPWLLAANYVFYLWSMPALGILLAATTGLSYGAGLLLDPDRGLRGRKWVLTGACLLHFGLLFACKYLQMCINLLALALPGLFANWKVELLLPAGISFFTFAVTGYLFDVYRGKLVPEKNILDYAVFVSFFPCILAGPIGQARSFLPQLRQRIPFRLDRLKAGLLRFAYGLFMKLVLADNIGTLVNGAYGGAVITPLTWIVVILLYSLQIYFDFAGYSHMAIGVAAAMGLTVPENFNAPYFATSVTSFWKKWHMSLTGWFREYLYFPLGGSRKGSARTCLNILIVFAVSGLWHGAALHYVLWGLVNGLFQVGERLAAGPRSRLETRFQGKASRVAWTLVCGVVTYVLVSFTWLLFRAEGIAQLRHILGQVFGLFRTGLGDLRLAELGLKPLLRWVLLGGVGLSALVDLAWMRGSRFQRLTQSVLPYALCLALLLGLAALFGVYGSGFDPQDFVYFRY